MNQETTYAHGEATWLGSPAVKLLLLLQAARPRQWIKNGVVFFALIFSGGFLNAATILASTMAFLAFCALASGAYMLNDIADAEKDRLHPRKRSRPIASGRLGKHESAVVASILAVGALVTGMWLGWPLALVLLVYFLLNTAYSFWLKSVILLDIFIVTFGFVLRALAGAFAIQVEPSPWLIIVTFFLALFLALAKRRAELTLLGEGGVEHRQVLQEYGVTMLDHLITIASAASIISYALYTFNSIQPRWMIITLPFVVYAIFRYLFLVHGKGKGGSPEEVFLTDPPFLVNMLLYTATVVAIVALSR